MMQRTTSPDRGREIVRRSTETIEGSRITLTKPGFVSATLSSVETMGVRSSVMPPHSAEWDITVLSNCRFPPASWESDRRAAASGGSMDARNGMPAILRACTELLSDR